LLTPWSPIELGRELSDTSDALIERFVAEARAAELSWTEIGQLFGTSKQAAQKRYGAAAAYEGRWPGRRAPAAHHALNHAGEQARELGHNYVGTEHALLGLLVAKDGLAAHVLADLGVTRKRILAQECIAASGPPHRALAVEVHRDLVRVQVVEHRRQRLPPMEIVGGVGPLTGHVDHDVGGLGEERLLPSAS
jgi:ATP-dependent Clp protease ATP-binding subunit ClpA